MSKKKLFKLQIVAICNWMLAQVIALCLILIPVLHQNMYIAYIVISVLGHFSTMRNLYGTSSDETHSKASHSKDDTKLTANSKPRPGSLETSMDESDRSVPLFNPFSPGLSISTPRTNLPEIQLETGGSSNLLDLDITGKLEGSAENLEEGFTQVNLEPIRET